MKILWIVLFLILAAVSCAPSLDDISLELSPADWSGPIRIVGADGPAELRRLTGRDASAAAGFPVEEMLRIEQGITDRPLVAGNKVELLKDGPATFEAMFAAMRTARHHIHLETFILDDDQLGRRLADILIERRQAGVEVRLVYDSIGALNTAEDYFARLRRHGIQVHEYHPLDPTDVIRLWRLNNRHHRKIGIIDGRIGFAGGLNISGVYASSSSGGKRSLTQGWRDTHVKVDGPAVAQLQRLFVALWARISGEPPLDGPEYFPPLAQQGRQLIRLVDSKAGDAEADIYRLYLAVIDHARSRIWITQGYFSPDRRLVEALVRAAHRKVDVRLLLPGLTDSWITLHSSRAHYSELLAAGVRIFERRDALQHAKTAVVDSIWSTVGSANLDYRSFLHANEANLVIWGEDFAGHMEDLFAADQAHNVEIRAPDWQRRPVGRKVLEYFASLFEYWL